MYDKGLFLVPLGGAGEIGLNLYLYGCDGDWLMVDCGIGFPDDLIPGVEILLPDPAFAETLGRRLRGLVLTHAHEDHYGAAGYLWSRLQLPVWCTRFCAALLRRRLDEVGIAARVPVHVVEPGREFEIGPFALRFLQLTHSIPESNALLLRTPHGAVLHSGDWKLDPEPLLGPLSDTDALKAAGEAGVLALVADSTNVFTPGTSGSEAEVKDSLRALIAAQPNRVALTTFASNLARLQTTVEVAREAGREVALVGRAMRRMVEVARECGYLERLPELIDERDAMSLPRERALFLVTGSQGEPRAALARIAQGTHPNVRLEPGDSCIFSAKIIPGNERTLYNLHNLLVRKGIEVITEHDHFVHVSGHPCRDELEQMLRWIRPRILVPVHGEPRHLHEHAAFARAQGVPEAVEILNGQVLRLAPGPAAVAGEVETGRLVLDAGEVRPLEDERYRARRRLMSHGSVVVGLVLDAYGSVIAPPQVTALGALDLAAAGDPGARIGDAIVDAIEAMADREVQDDERVREAVRGALRRAAGLGRDQRPIVEVQITRLSAEALAALEDDVGAS